MRVSACRHSEGTRQDLPERQDHERVRDMVGPGRRFPFGLPRTDTAKDRAGFIMANTTKSAHSCSMKITEDDLEYATEEGIAEEVSLRMGMEE